ncbi:MAG: DNA primase [Chitinophagales bacterium]|nr:DNA primase [Chitinophagales bacterium]
MISTRSKEEILSVSHVEEVIGEYVNLKKRGANYVGLCPFHTERTPSFHVSPSKGIYKCFGCGKAGDSVKFIMEHEKVTYPEALRFLAQKYNIEIEETGNTQQVQNEKLVKESLLIVTQFAQLYYHDQLLKSQEGKTIGLAYFKERGVTEEMIKKFSLGYALKDPEAFTHTAIKNGYQLDLLKKAGLVVQRGTSDSDFFHHRIIFSLHNLSGKAIAFAGRIMAKADRAPKYINSPESELYHKSHFVYGIFQARNAIRQNDECFLAEGYMDVIAAHMAGIENIVASSGTSLTQEQIKLIRRFTNNITLLYDGDAAGIKAALRGLEIMAAEDVNVRVVLLPDGEDPDSFLHKHGSTAMREFIRNNKKHFIQFKVELLLSEAGNDPLKRAEVIKDVVNTLAVIPDVVKRSVLIKECSQMLSIDEQVLVIETNKIKRQQLKKESVSAAGEVSSEYDKIDKRPESLEITSVSGDNYQERDILRILLEFGTKKMNDDTSVAEYILSEVKEIPISNILYQLIMHEMEDQLQKGNIPDLQLFLQHSDARLQSLTVDIITSPYQLSENWNKMHDIFVKLPQENFRNDVVSSLDRFKLKHVIKMIEENLKDIKAATGKAEEETHYQMVHRRLNEWKMSLGKKMGTVVVN